MVTLLSISEMSEKKEVGERVLIVGPPLTLLWRMSATELLELGQSSVPAIQ
jgi:hypothetical protein